MDGVGPEQTRLQSVQVPLQGAVSLSIFYASNTLIITCFKSASQRIPGQPPLPVYVPSNDEASNDEEDKNSSATEADDGITQSETAVGSVSGDDE